MVVLDKIKEIVSRFTISKFVQYALLILLIKLVFFSNKVNKIEYIDQNPNDSSMTILMYEIHHYEKGDSIIKYRTYEKMDRIDSLPDTAVVNGITDWVRRNRDIGKREE